MPRKGPDPVDFSAYRLKQQLDTDKSGRPLGTLANIVEVLRGTDAVRVAYNVFAERVEIDRAPWKPDDVTRELRDDDEAAARVWFEREIGLKPPKAADVFAAMNLVARDRPRDPPRDYLEAQRWDGVRRLRWFAERYLGAGDAIEPDEHAGRVLRYVQRVSVKFLIAAVARVFEPGCTADNVLVLIGPQGKLKTSAVRVMFSPWCASLSINPHARDSVLAIRGLWGIEWSELDGMSRAEHSASKRFLSEKVDRFREPYARRIVDVKRRCVIVATVNESTFLRDSTGNRRYWPVRVGAIDLEALKRDRDQLWAEAVRWYRRGFPWWVTTADRELFEEQQERRHEPDAFEERLGEFLADRPDTPEWQLTTLLKDALGLEPARWTPSEQRRAGNALRRLGWTRRKVWRGARSIWAWQRKDGEGASC